MRLMTISPRNLIFPAVLACCICLTTLSISVNTGFAQQAFPKTENINSEKGTLETKLSSRFPENIQRWKTIIESAAVESGLDPNLIAAVMLQESGGNPQAYSTSGAVGLMQVMPKDGIASEFICGSNPCFINRPTINELLNPLFNVNYGSNYLAGLVRQKGSQREALYTYGPMDMDYGYADIVLTILENYR
jgi:soluble lytic murein transglycosylase-like protein